MSPSTYGNIRNIRLRPLVEFSAKVTAFVIFSCDIARICFSCQTSGSVFRPNFLAFLSPTAPIDTEICFRRASAGARIPDIFSSTL